MSDIPVSDTTLPSADQVSALTKAVEENNRQQSSLITAIGTLTETVGELKESDRKHGTYIGLLGVSFFLDVCLTIGMFYVGHKAQVTANQVADNQHATCISSNEGRALQIKLWNYVLAFPPPANETTDQAARRTQNVAKFKVFLNTTYAPRDCSKIHS